MTEEMRQDEFAEGMQRIESVGRRLGDMFGQGKDVALNIKGA